MNAVPAIPEQGEPVDLFSYAALTREEEVAAREDAAIIKTRMRRVAEDIVVIGQALIRQKENLPHGMFLKWVDAEFEFSRSSAHRFMNVARVFGDKFTSLGNLGIEALDALAAPSTPESVRSEVESLLVDGQKVTLDDIKRMKAEASGAEIVKSEAERLRITNAQLQRKANELSDEERERLGNEARRDAERLIAERTAAMTARVADLERKLREASKPAQEAAPTPASDDRRPAGPEHDVFEDDDDRTPKGKEAAAVFSSCLHKASGLTFTPDDFWAPLGRSATKEKLAVLLDVQRHVSELVHHHHMKGPKG